MVVLPNVPNERSVRMADDEHIGIDPQNLFFPAIRLFSAIAE